MNRMTSTEDLISSLSHGATPIRRLASPLFRAAGVIAVATMLIAAFVAVRGFRADLSSRLGDVSFLLSIGAAWLTGAAATLGAFEISLPDRPRLWALLPGPSLVLWLWGVGYGCLAHWVAIPFGAPVAQASMRCLETLIGTSVPLGLILFLSLRRSHPLRSSETAWLGALAVAAFADTAHLLIHVVEATELVLLMNFVVVAALTALGGMGGVRLLRR